MAKIIEKIKNLFSGKVVFKSKCGAKKEEAKPKQETSSQEKSEEKKTTTLNIKKLRVSI